MADKEPKNLMMRTLLERLEELLLFSSGPINYEMLSRAFKELSGALFTAISTYENNRKESLTRVFSGPPELINQACTILELNSVGKRGPLASKD